MTVPKPPTDAQIDQLLALVRGGSYRTTAGRLLGVGAEAVERWLRADPVLRQRVELAESELERQLVETVIEAALNDPKQANWLLERKFRNHWGRTSQDSGAETAPRYSDDVLKAWVEKRTEQKQGQS